MTGALSRNMRQAWTSSGRTSRPDFWSFAPVALVPPVLFAMQVDWLVVEFWGIWKLAVLFLLSLPLLNAAARRLQDTGMEGTSAFYPFAPFVVLWVGYQCILRVGWAVGVLTGPWVILVWLLALLILTPLHIIALVASLFLTSSVIGQMLVSSDPGSNRYGPNPHEATA
jgi:uncharacterized membrane protein YhaH (DUF805 family)